MRLVIASPGAQLGQHHRGAPLREEELRRGHLADQQFLVADHEAGEAEHHPLAGGGRAVLLVEGVVGGIEGLGERHDRIVVLAGDENLADSGEDVLAPTAIARGVGSTGSAMRCRAVGCSPAGWSAIQGQPAARRPPSVANCAPRAPVTKIVARSRLIVMPAPRRCGRVGVPTGDRSPCLGSRCALTALPGARAPTPRRRARVRGVRTL